METAARMRQDAPQDQVDKWQVLTDLGMARTAFGLSDRTLSVLHVLVSFDGDRALHDDALTVVYASNASLMRRAHGMPESTLRRHLAALVQSGMIARHDSPNGKRYLRPGADGSTRAFGFDLRPLLIRAGEIARAAQAVREAQAHRAMLREEVVLLMRDATALLPLADGNDAVCDPLTDRLALARRQMRRKLDAETLTTMRDTLRDLVQRMTDRLLPDIAPAEPVDTVVEAGDERHEMSACDSRNERHIQVSDKTSIESEPPTRRLLDRRRLAQILTACPDVGAYADESTVTPQSFLSLMARLAPMSGIDAPTWAEACRSMGPEHAAVTLAAMVQRIGAIRSPGAYLRRLSQKARERQFTPDGMIAALMKAA